MFPEGRAFEFLIVAIAALVFVGPKDLPALLRKLGQFMARLRAMAAEFRASFDEMARQSELDELRREVEAMRAAAQQPAAYAASSVGLDEVDRETRAGFEPPQTELEPSFPPPETPAAAKPRPRPKARPSAR